MKNQSIEHAAYHWDTVESWEGWVRIPAVWRRLNAKVSGNPDTEWYSYVVNAHLAGRVPVPRCLSLGCGRGWLERRLAGLEVFESCDAYDVSPASIDAARQLSLSEGYDHITYTVADINQLDLPQSTYDVVWVNSAMHHFERLEHICGQIQQSLKPQGLLVLNEYVGPCRFQFSVRQQEVIDAAFRLLPRRYRALTRQQAAATLDRSPRRRGLRWTATRLEDKLRDGDLLPALRRRWEAWRAVRSDQENLYRLVFPTARDIAAADPSEAARSSEIMRIVSDSFDVLERKDLGGTLLQFLLNGIAVTFCSDDPEAQSWLNLMFQIEDTVLTAGDLQSDFVLVVARPKVRS